jgi:hypothetical protein
MPRPWRTPRSPPAGRGRRGRRTRGARRACDRAQVTCQERGRARRRAEVECAVLARGSASPRTRTGSIRARCPRATTATRSCDRGDPSPHQSTNGAGTSRGTNDCSWIHLRRHHARAPRSAKMIQNRKWIEMCERHSVAHECTESRMDRLARHLERRLERLRSFSDRAGSHATKLDSRASHGGRAERTRLQMQRVCVSRTPRAASRSRIRATE